MDISESSFNTSQSSHCPYSTKVNSKGLRKKQTYNNQEEKSSTVCKGKNKGCAQ